MKEYISLVFFMSVFIGCQETKTAADKTSDVPQEKSTEKRLIETIVNTAETSNPQQTPAEIPAGIKLGIESIKRNKDNTVTIAVYMIADKPVAGFQMEISPSDILELKSLQDGRAGAAGFTMQGGKSGKLLGFSMTGVDLPVSTSPNPGDNILFTVTATVSGKLGKELPVYLNKVIIAAPGGKRLAADSESFNWQIKK